MRRILNSRAEMGIGTLIIFIALLLVAAVAAGVLIQSAGSLQEKALSTGDQAKGQIATNVKVVEVSATDGQDTTLEEFEQIIKLSPGSGDIKLSQVLLTMNTYDATATLTYRGATGQNENNMTTGFYTINEEVLPIGISNASTTNLAEDYDLDGSLDTVTLGDDGYLFFDFSGGNTLNVTDFDCAGADASITGNYSISGSDEIDNIQAEGTCGSASTNATIITITPKKNGEGFFTAEYLQRGTNPVAGNLQTGDIIKLYYESPRSVTEDEKIRTNLIPKLGTPTLTEYISPEVISDQRVYLYP